MPILPPAAVPIGAYHDSVPQWLSKTSLRDYIDHGPAWWHKAYITKTLKRQTPEGAEQGLALDCYLTEGADTYGDRYVIKPEGHDGRTKEGKAWLAGLGDRKAISAKDHAILMDAVDAVRGCACWSDIERAKAQQTIRRESPSLGLGLQARPDWIDLDRGALWFDLKKTRDLDLFGKQAINLGYHLQASVGRWTLAGEGIQMGPAILIAVEWEPGARCRPFEIPEYAIDDGEKQMRDAAAAIADHIKRNDWTNPQAPVAPLEIPEYMRRKMEQ
jgi:hypothetical protein